jgi:hypothetical protein
VTYDETQDRRDNLLTRYPSEYEARQAARQMGQWLCTDAKGWWYVVGYYRLREAIARGFVGMPWKR